MFIDIQPEDVKRNENEKTINSFFNPILFVFIRFYLFRYFRFSPKQMTNLFVQFINRYQLSRTATFFLSSFAIFTRIKMCVEAMARARFKVNKSINETAMISSNKHTPHCPENVCRSAITFSVSFNYNLCDIFLYFR